MMLPTLALARVLSQLLLCELRLLCDPLYRHPQCTEGLYVAAEDQCIMMPSSSAVKQLHMYRAAHRRFSERVRSRCVNVVATSQGV